MKTVVREGERAASRRSALIVAGVVVSIAAALLFARLGHYALWDDEAITALVAKGILRTGDTSAEVDGHNIAAYRGGVELRGLRNRYVPPLQSYLVAPFLSIGGTGSAGSARFVFAVLGLATFALLMAWVRRFGATLLTTLLVGLGSCCNVSLILYSRQCRYYAAAIFLSVLIAFIYTRDRLTRRDLGLLSALSALLFATNYLNYAALYACLALDYLLWGRRRHKLAPSDWAILLVPQVVCCSVIGLIWGPLALHAVAGGESRSWIADRFRLLYWNLRDMDLCEFFAPPAIVAAAVAAARPGATLLRRGLAAFVCYLVAITVLSPQSLAVTRVADIRYLAPLLPLFVTLEVGAVVAWAGARPWLATLLALVLFGTNVASGAPFLGPALQSTIAEYVHELAVPPPDPYSAASEWIRDHVPANASVWVSPDYMTFPLIFHAPGAVYAWQLAGDNRDPQFAGLPAIHFKRRVPPDYRVCRLGAQPTGKL